MPVYGCKDSKEGFVAELLRHPQVCSLYFPAEDDEYFVIFTGYIFIGFYTFQFFLKVSIVEIEDISG